MKLCNGFSAITASQTVKISWRWLHLQLLSDAASAPSEEKPEPTGVPTEVFDGLEEVRSLLAQAGIAPEDRQDPTS